MLYPDAVREYAESRCTLDFPSSDPIDLGPRWDESLSVMIHKTDMDKDGWTCIASWDEYLGCWTDWIVVPPGMQA